MGSITSRLQQDTKRAKELLATARGVKPCANRYSRVTYRPSRERWQVKVKYQGEIFYKLFKDEGIAAWVADAAAILMMGKPGTERIPQNEWRGPPLNFNWKHGIPACPNPKITVMTVYQWLVEKGLTVRVRPSSAAGVARQPKS